MRTFFPFFVEDFGRFLVRKGPGTLCNAASEQERRLCHAWNPTVQLNQGSQVSCADGVERTKSSRVAHAHGGT